MSSPKQQLLDEINKAACAGENWTFDPNAALEPVETYPLVSILAKQNKLNAKRWLRCLVSQNPNSKGISSDESAYLQQLVTGAPAFVRGRLLNLLVHAWGSKKTHIREQVLPCLRRNEEFSLLYYRPLVSRWTCSLLPWRQV